MPDIDNSTTNSKAATTLVKVAHEWRSSFAFLHSISTWIALLTSLSLTRYWYVNVVSFIRRYVSITKRRRRRIDRDSGVLFRKKSGSAFRLMHTNYVSTCLILRLCCLFCAVIFQSISSSPKSILHIMFHRLLRLMTFHCKWCYNRRASKRNENKTKTKETKKSFYYFLSHTKNLFEELTVF